MSVFILPLQPPPITQLRLTIGLINRYKSLLRHSCTASIGASIVASIFVFKSTSAEKGATHTALPELKWLANAHSFLISRTIVNISEPH